MARKPVTSGRSSSAVASALREDILKARVDCGQYLTSVRALATTHAINAKTAFRALKLLESEGLIRAVRGQGFQVLARAAAPSAGTSVAYIGDRDPASLGGVGSTAHLIHEIQQAAARRSWCLTILPGDASLVRARTALREHRVLGAVVSSLERQMVADLKGAGVPLVLVDASFGGLDADAVMQDGQHGGALAAEFLLARGRSRVAWLGNPHGSAHLTDRLGGAMAAFQSAGRPLAPERILPIWLSRVEEELRRLFSLPEPPDALLVPWTNYMLAAAQACRNLGLQVGRDVDLVGWCSQEVLERDLAGQLAPETASAAIVWSAREMAETALSRLVERREHPDLPPALIKVPTRLMSFV